MPACVCSFFTLTLLEPQPRSGDKPVKFQVAYPQNGIGGLKGLALLEPQCRSGDKPVKLQVAYPQNGTGGLKGLNRSAVLLAGAYR